MSDTDCHYRFLLLCLSGRASSLPGDPHWRWERFIETASDESLVTAIYSLLQNSGLLSRIPADISEFFFAARELNRIRNAQIRERVRVAASALNQVGIEPLLLKGFAYLLHYVYPDSADRFLVDIDMLVAKSELPRALSVMRRLGYCSDQADPVDRATNHTYAVLSRSDSMTIDLHQTLGLGASSWVLPPEEVLARCIPVQVDGARLRLPSPEDLVIHHILHSQVHELYRDRVWTPLRSLHDLALLQQRFAPAIDWTRIAHRFRTRRLYGTLALYLLQAETSLGFKRPLPLRIGPVLKLRWWHRQLLRKTPQVRFIDPFWFYSAGIVPRTRRLHDILHQPGGVRYLCRKLFSVDFFSRLKADLS